MYSMNIFTKAKEPRIYINGTTRKAVYFMEDKKGRLVWSSKTNDTPPKYRTGNHYGKWDKDRDAAHLVAEIFGLTLGDGSEGEFARAWKMAEDGIQLEGDI